ncbi:MAG: hypothetical protein GY822_08680 [Deltaproteobacteria bacterium]|nr:hypothetical protein [Deltaproteobacteria bacterium]
MFRLLALIVPILLLLCATDAQSQTFLGTRGRSLGGAYRAVATGSDAIYANPAGIIQIPRYATELHYNFDLYDDLHQGNFTLVDSKTSVVGVGLGYNLKLEDLASDRFSVKNEATGALAYTIIPKIFSVGAAFKYVNLTDAIAGNYLNALSADVGLLATLPGGVNLAAVGYNLVPIKSSEVPISAAFAASWNLGPLSALIMGGTPTWGPTIDASGAIKPPNPMNPAGMLDGLVLSLDWYIEFFTLYGPQNEVSAGVEYLILQTVPVRAGYTWNQHGDEHVLSVGAGFIVPTFGLDVAYQQSVTDFDDRNFSVSIKFFLDFLVGM